VSRYVTEASVAVKWLVEEVFSDHARRVLTSRDDLIAPTFAPNEVGSAFLKKIRRGEMQADIARRALPYMMQRIRLEPVTAIVGAAMDFALAHDRSIFDSFYVLLAIREGCSLVTADERLYNSLRSTYSEHMIWIEDFSADASV
jgi:predicted nucleic acid-binding protein